MIENLLLLIASWLPILLLPPRLLLTILVLGLLLLLSSSPWLLLRTRLLTPPLWLFNVLNMLSHIYDILIIEIRVILLYLSGHLGPHFKLFTLFVITFTLPIYWLCVLPHSLHLLQLTLLV